MKLISFTLLFLTIFNTICVAALRVLVAKSLRQQEQSIRDQIMDRIKAFCESNDQVRLSDVIRIVVGPKE